MTEDRKENPQKAISKKWLAQALLELMEERPYNQITVTEITERAQLSRRTFYRHYTVVDDILNSIMDHLCKQYIALLLKQQKYDFRTLAFVYFQFWDSHKSFLLTLEKSNLLLLLLQKYNDYFHEIRRGVIGDTDHSGIAEYAFYFNAGGFWNLHLKLLKDGTVLSPWEMAGLAEKILHHSN